MSVDFTPGRGDYTPLKPFRFWCQKILPLVYDDSLSYYELLCKVVDYLNKTMEDVETLEGDISSMYEAYEQLETYVNEYFDNLDVQEEINNKLDEMSSTGELSALISKYVKPFLEEQTEYNEETRNYVNERLLYQDNEINNIKYAIGSPLVANTAAEMTDTDRVYVYTGNETGYNNGDWYYYNGTEWVSGGTYNSESYTTDKTLTVENAPADSYTVGTKTNLLYNGSKNKPYLHELSFTKGISISSINGELISVPNIRAATEGYYECQDSMVVEPNPLCNISIVLYDYNKGYLIETEWITGTFTLDTTNASYFRLIAKMIDNSNIPDETNFVVSLHTIEKTIDTIIEKTSTDIFAENIIEIDAEELTGVITIGLNPNPTTGARKVINVKPGEKYLISGYIYTNDYPLIIYTLDDKYIRSEIGGVVGASVTNYSFTVPSNVTKLYVNGKPNEVSIKKYIKTTKDAISYLNEIKQPKEIETIDKYEDISKITEQGAITPSLSVNPSTGAHNLFNVSENETYSISGYTYVLDIYPLIIFYNNDTLVSYINGRTSAGTVDNYEITIPAGVNKMYVNGRPYNIIVKKKIKTVEDAIGVLFDKYNTNWQGKTIVWFGTSIPAGGFLGSEHPNAYPQQVGRLLECTVINEAIGSSCISAKSPTRISENNPYGFNTNFEASSRCITNSLTEMNWIIDNKSSSIWTSGVPSDWSDWWAEKIRSFSYENLIDKYLTEDNMPDAFVFDYGHNDSDHTTSEYESYGEYSPYTFRGGMNFLIRRILSYKPDAKIIMIGEYAQTRQVPQMQTDVARDWNIPLIKMWELLGWSKEKEIATNGRWVLDTNTGNYTWVIGATTQSVFDAIIPDKIHPFTNPTGEPDKKIARIIAENFSII